MVGRSSPWWNSSCRLLFCLVISCTSSRLRYSSFGSGAQAAVNPPVFQSYLNSQWS